MPRRNPFKGWQPPKCPGEALRNTLAFDPRDWSLNKRDAWLYGIILGWSEEPETGDPDNVGGTLCTAMEEVATMHGWTDEDVARLRRLHEAFDQAFPTKSHAGVPT